MKLKDFLLSNGMSLKDFKKLSKEEQKALRKAHEEINRIENIAIGQELKKHYEKIEEERRKDLSDEGIYKNMYNHLYGIFGTGLEKHKCSGELKLTKRYLDKYCTSKKQYDKILYYIQEHGGYCDCEVLLNCPPVMKFDVE